MIMNKGYLKERNIILKKSVQNIALFFEDETLLK